MGLACRSGVCPMFWQNKDSFLVLRGFTILAFILFLNASTCSSGLPNEVMSLKDVKGPFSVFVAVGEEAQELGLSENSIKNQIELKLRLASIEVENDTKIWESILVEVDTNELEGLDLFSTSIAISFYQQVIRIQDYLSAIALNAFIER